MPNIGTVLKQEISRLSKKESKVLTDGIRRASAQYRHDIATLKRKLAELERRIGQLGKSSHRASAAGPEEVDDKPRMRFVAKGLHSLRVRLGLSAADLGVLLDASAQSVYNWENGSTKPRASQLAKIAGLRGVSKKQAHERLAELQSAAKSRTKSTRKTRKAS